MILPVLLAVAAAACLPVDPGQEQLHGSDLARAGGAAKGFPADAIFGYAPAPGVTKTFTVATLQRYARQYGMPEAPQQDICFALEMQPLTGERVDAALRATFGNKAKIELVDYLRSPTPAGDLIFAANLSPAGNASTVRGYVRYGHSHRFAVWAKAKIEVPVSRPVAANDIPLGGVVTPEAVVWSPCWEARGSAERSLAPRELASTARRAIRAGETIHRRDIQTADTVRRGDSITLEAPLGNTNITIQGIVESGGKEGDSIRVRNPSSGKVIRALLVERGKAIVK